MKIQKILRQHRRDFRAVYECESCGHTKEGSGYDDYNFHQSIIPNMACDKCGAKTTAEYRALRTKYPEDMTV